MESVGILLTILFAAALLIIPVAVIYTLYQHGKKIKHLKQDVQTLKEVSTTEEFAKLKEELEAYKNRNES